LQFFLGFKIMQAKDILKKFKMDDSKPLSTPMSTTHHWTRTRTYACGPEGLLEHDRLPLVLDGDEAGLSVLFVSVRSFSGVVEDFTPAGRQADLQVSSIHS
jgi:hypothetical protein